MAFPDPIEYGVENCGAITGLPGMGRRQVNLSEFRRVGLAHLANKSFIRNEARSKEIHDTYMGITGYEMPDTVCASCERTFGDICDYTATSLVAPRYQIVKFVPANEQYKNGKASYAGNDAYMITFCFDCAAERDAMVTAIAAHKYGAKLLPTIADDGQDVYAFVAQTITEDRLHGTAGYENIELRMLAGGYYGGGDGSDNPKAFYHVIGGRLMAHRLNVIPRQSALDARNERAVQRRIKAAAKAEQDAMAASTDTADATVTADSSASLPEVATVQELPEPVKAKSPRRRAAKYER